MLRDANPNHIRSMLHIRNARYVATNKRSLGFRDLDLVGIFLLNAFPFRQQLTFKVILGVSHLGIERSKNINQNPAIK